MNDDQKNDQNVPNEGGELSPEEMERRKQEAEETATEEGGSAESTQESM